MTTREPTMTITDLISALEDVRATYGDMPVLVTAPAPDADPFVKLGDDIKAGDTVCIIEAMKMFNRIEADFGGKIVEILVENGQPVEYDEPLFVVK